MYDQCFRFTAFVDVLMENEDNLSFVSTSTEVFISSKYLEY